MSKINKHVEIVRSNIKELSSMSQESCDSIFNVLNKHFTNVGITVINNSTDLEGLLVSRPDLVFLGMKFIPSTSVVGTNNPDRIWLSEALDEYGISYTGSGQSAHELEFNKPLAKQRVLDFGLKTSAFCVIKQNQQFNINDVPSGFPLFVKPISRGGGLGIDSNSVVHNFEQLRAKVDAITTKLCSDVLIENYLPGREFSVAILRDERTSTLLTLPIELIAPPDRNGSRLLSNKVKASNTEQAIIVPEGLIKTRVIELALNTFIALGARDYGRIDIRLDASGIPYFLEANLIPSLISGYGSFPKACLINSNLEYEPMIMRIAELGLSHNINDTIDIDKGIISIVQDIVLTEPAFKLA